MPGGKPGGLKPGGGPGIPGGGNGIGGRAIEGIPTKGWQKVSSRKRVNDARQNNSLGGIIPIPRPAGMPRPGPTGSFRIWT
jgi:hypothetical protein